jgi:hypothetical protein
MLTATTCLSGNWEGPERHDVDAVTATLIVVLWDKFLDWVQLNRSTATDQGWWRPQSFARA